jgi:hypothetical protein
MLIFVIFLQKTCMDVVLYCVWANEATTEEQTSNESIARNETSTYRVQYVCRRFHEYFIIWLLNPLSLIDLTPSITQDSPVFQPMGKN